MFEGTIKRHLLSRLLCLVSKGSGARAVFIFEILGNK